MQRVSTDFPAPLSPHRPVTWPAGRSRLTWYSACTGPKCLSISRSFSNASGTGHAPAAGPAARQDIDQHRAEEHGAGNDVLPLRGQPEQGHAVGDAADDEAAEDAVDRLTTAAKEAGAADGRGSDREEDELTGVRRVRAELAVEERAEQDAGDPRGDRAEDENPGPDGRQAHAGSSGCFGIAADGVDIAAEAGPLEQERPGAKHGEDD